MQKCTEGKVKTGLYMENMVNKKAFQYDAYCPFADCTLLYPMPGIGYSPPWIYPPTPWTCPPTPWTCPPTPWTCPCPRHTYPPPTGHIHPPERTWYQRCRAPCGQRDTYENITFRQIRWRAVILQDDNVFKKIQIRSRKLIIGPKNHY